MKAARIFNLNGDPRLAPVAGRARVGRERPRTRRAQMSGLPKKEECVCVVVRCRPMSRKETEDNRQKVVEMDKHRGCVRDRCLARAFTHHHACLWCGR